MNELVISFFKANYSLNLDPQSIREIKGSFSADITVEFTWRQIN